MTRSDLIRGKIQDLVANFMYYDRRGDGQLPLNAIEEAIKAGEITVDEIAEIFRENIARQVR